MKRVYDSPSMMIEEMKLNDVILTSSIGKEFDEKNVDLIVVEGCDEKGLGFSIMNRLKKSASGNIKYID